MKALHPDVFLGQLLADSPDEFLVTMRTHRLALRKPAISVERYLATLKTLGLPETVRSIEVNYSERLD